MKKNEIKKIINYTCILFAFNAVNTSYAGSIFVTGHDADDHDNIDYQRAGLDFVTFGKEATGTNLAARSNVSIGYIGTSDGSDVASGGYTAPTFIDVGVSGWENTAFTSGFDVLIIGTGFDYLSQNGSDEINSKSTEFATYFNNGGNLLVFSDQGIGQSFYDFIPSFGTTTNNSIDNSGVFSPTLDGVAIGLTESIVDADITHSIFTNVDSNTFKTLEIADSSALFDSLNGEAVAIGLFNGKIDVDDGFVSAVPVPAAVWLFGSGLLGLASVLGRRKKRL